MYRGSTPQLNIKVKTELDFDNVTQIWLTLRPTANNEITFEMDRMEIDNEEKIIKVLLTQEETLALSEGTCKVQIRLLLQNGMAFVSTKSEVNVDGILKEGVIE